MFSIAAFSRAYLGPLILVCVLLTGAGVVCAMNMPSGVYPEVTFPRIAVVAKVPNQDVTNMEIKVTRPLEQAVSSVIGVSMVRSKTIRGGSEVTIDFDANTDMNRAEQLTRDRISSIRSELPPGSELTVEQMTPSIFPILSVVLTAGDNAGPETAARLRDYAFYQLAPRIKNTPDVSRADVAGGDLREIEVICRPDDLLTHGLSAADLADQIGKLTPLEPIGRVENEPLAYQLIVNNQAAKAQEIADLAITTRKDQPVRVRDVADVKILHQDRVLSIGYDVKDAVVITVFRRLKGNTVEISQNVAALLDKEDLRRPIGDPAKKAPHDIKATIVYDQAGFVQTAVSNVRDAIFIGGLFSILILLAFLRSWRATLLSAISIPMTLAITFLFLYLSGKALRLFSLDGLATLNLMSLGGLAVAVGLIIDDTVVVIENIARHLTPSATKGTSDAVDAASGEITGAVIGSTLTTVLVFVPLAFISGVYGQFFASLGLSLVIAVLVSMVISLTIIPVVAARFLGGKPMPEPGRIYRALAAVYDRGLAAALRFPGLTLTFSMVIVAFGILLVTGVPDPPKELWTRMVDSRAARSPKPPLVPAIKTGLMPAMDEGTFVLDYWAPSGSPLAETERKTKEIEKILARHPDVQSWVRRTGAENGLFATQTSRGDFQVVLRPAAEDPVSLWRLPVRPPLDDLEKTLKAEGKTLKDEKANIQARYRRRSITKIREEVEDQVKDLFSENQLKIETVQVMADELSDLSGANKPIEVKLFGPDQRQLRELADKVADKLKEKGKGRGIKDVNSNVRQGNPDLMIQLDHVQANKLGLGLDDVTRQLRAIFQGQIATRIPETSLRITDVRVRYPDRIRFGTDADGAKGSFDRQLLLDQWILMPESKLPTLPNGQAALNGPLRAAPLYAFGDVKPVRTPDEQWRENQQPAIFVTAELNEDEAGLGAVAADIRDWMTNDVQLPPGYRWEMGGHYLRQQEAFSSLLFVTLVALMLVFIMLTIQFQSVMLPLVMMFVTQPLSVAFGIFALWITDIPLNVSSYMGVILLIGLDMKNGILLVEYIQRLRKEGMLLRPALMLAGHTRFRPILMTSLAAIMGLFPLALGIGPGAQMQQPLAVMVIGGLTANMLFTRMVIPAGYLVWERLTTARVRPSPFVDATINQS